MGDTGEEYLSLVMTGRCRPCRLVGVGRVLVQRVLLLLCFLSVSMPVVHEAMTVLMSVVSVVAMVLLIVNRKRTLGILGNLHRVPKETPDPLVPIARVDHDWHNTTRSVASTAMVAATPRVACRRWMSTGPLMSSCGRLHW